MLRKIICSVFIVFLLGGIFIISNSEYKKDENDIAESLSQNFPIGTFAFDVCNEIDMNSKWDIDYIRVFENDVSTLVYKTEDLSKNATIKEIRVHIGHYVGFLSRTDVVCCFVFDNNKLTDIKVEKFVDSL